MGDSLAVTLNIRCDWGMDKNAIVEAPIGAYKMQENDDKF